MRGDHFPAGRGDVGHFGQLGGLHVGFVTLARVRVVVIPPIPTQPKDHIIVKKALSLASVALVAVASLTACGGGSSSSADDYCDIYKSAHQDLGDLDFSQLDEGSMDQAKDYMDQLKDAAPTDKLQSAWETTSGAFDTLTAELDKLGMSMSDLKNINGADDLPKGVSVQDIQHLAKKIKDLDQGGKMEKASQTIEKYGKDTCKVDA